MTKRLWRVVGIGLLGCLPLGPAAKAQESGSAALEAGKKSYWGGQFEQSIRQLEPLLGTLTDRLELRDAAFFLGLNHRALGSVEKSRGYFEQAVRQDPAFVPSEDLVSPPQMSAYFEVRARLVGQLSVESEPSAARVLIDGKLVGKTPYQSAVLAGTQGVRVEADGYAAQDRQVAVSPGETATVRVLLAPARAAAQPPAKPATPTVARAKSKGASKSLIIAGAGLAGLGVWLAATSKESSAASAALPSPMAVKPPSSAELAARPDEPLDEPTRSKPKLYGGLAMIGGGGVLIWLGARNRNSEARTDIPGSGKRSAVLLSARRKQVAAYYVVSW